MLYRTVVYYTTLHYTLLYFTVRLIACFKHFLMYMYIHMFARAYIRVHAGTCSYTCAHTHTHTHPHSYTHAPTRKHTRTQTPTHTHTHTQSAANNRACHHVNQHYFHAWYVDDFYLRVWSLVFSTSSGHADGRGQRDRRSSTAAAHDAGTGGLGYQAAKDWEAGRIGSLSRSKALSRQEFDRSSRCRVIVCRFVEDIDCPPLRPLLLCGSCSFC